MSKIRTSYYHSPLGELIIGIFKNQLCMLDWRYRKKRNAVNKRISQALNADFIEESDPLHQIVIDELERYFLGELKTFKVPFIMVGSDFQKSVWNELVQIPYGTTMSYITLSRKLNNEKAIRAVASANGANALSIVIPCHRIIGTNGDLTGYAGGLQAKKKLLNLEGALNKNQLELF